MARRLAVAERDARRAESRKTRKRHYLIVGQLKGASLYAERPKGW
jgi:hypothetical protein